ncbi:MAG TPA: DoxX family protein [Vicinamibacteria bacterium]|nr:DoxX family protein [Vicinamibacteria bacterium]
MPQNGLVQGAARFGLRVATWLFPLAPLLTRLVLGQAFFLTGRGKLEHFQNTVEFFTQLGIPLPALNAAFVSRLEFYGGIALAIGLLTRLVAAGLASSMVVALLTADRGHFLDALYSRGDAGLTDITPFVYLLFLLWLVLAGPGLISLDALLARAIGLRPQGPPSPGSD